MPKVNAQLFINVALTKVTLSCISPQSIADGFRVLLNQTSSEKYK